MRPLCQPETAHTCQDDACVGVVRQFSCLSVAPIAPCGVNPVRIRPCHE